MLDENRTELIGVRLTKSEVEAIETICETQQISKSVFLRMLVKDYLMGAIEYVR